MIKASNFKICGILLLLLTMSCTTNRNIIDEDITVNIYSSPINFSETGFLNYLQTKPLNGAPVFFASVKRMSNREDEKTAALLEASEQASKFIAVKAVAKFYSEKINSSIKYIRDLDVIWDKDLAVDMIDNLDIINIAQDTYGSYILASLSDEKTISVPWQSKKINGKPDWTSRAPQIPGYITSVGIALQTGYVADSFAAADNQALEDLARQISVKIINGKKLIENGTGTASIQTSYEISEVVIPGFYIIERWRTPDARYYYSLAIAPESIIEHYRNE